MKTGWLALAVAAAIGSVRAEPPRAPSGWPTSTPEAQDLDGAALEALHHEFADGRHGYVDGMLVIRHGQVVFERSYRHGYERLFESRGGPRGPYNYYDPDWHPYHRGSDLHTLQSVSKSVTATLVGIALRRGELPGLDVPVARYFEGFKLGEDPRRSRMTLRHLLTMTAGIEWDESSVTYTDPKNSCARMEASSDWVQFVLDQPMAAEPGSAFVYNSGITILLAQVLKAATGRQADDYAAEQLFQPLGIEHFYWKRTPTGLPDTEGGLYLTPRDLARLGQLYLQDGVWEGRRLLPEGWVRDATAPHVETRESDERPLRYGYQWWVLPGPANTHHPAYAAIGFGGQRLIVVPELEIVAVFTGWNIYDKPPLSPLFALDRVVAAVKTPSAARGQKP